MHGDGGAVVAGRGWGSESLRFCFRSSSFDLRLTCCLVALAFFLVHVEDALEFGRGLDLLLGRYCWGRELLLGGLCCYPGAMLALGLGRWDDPGLIGHRGYWGSFARSGTKRGGGGVALG